MRTAILTLAMILLVAHVGLSGNYRGRSNEAAKGSIVRVLVIGFEDTQLNSNYFLYSEIAEKTHIPADSLGIHFNRKVLESLIGNSNQTVEMVPLTDYAQLIRFYRNVKYIEQNDRIRSEFLNPSHQQLQELVNTYKADYILFMNSYELRWQGHPFNTLFHVLSYDLFNRSFQNIFNGFTSFNQSELSPLSQVELKMNRQMGRVVSQVVRTVR